MSSPDKNHIEQKLLKLQQEFKNGLSQKVDAVDKLWQSIVLGNASDNAISDCYRMAHTLIGSGGTFGALMVSTVSHELEQVFKSLLSDIKPSAEINDVVSKLIIKLRQASEQWQPSKKSYVEPVDTKYVNDINES